MTPNVLVLLAAYRGESFLEDQVKSILGQKGLDVQLLVSVDPGPDLTDEVVDRLCLQADNISQLRHDRGAGGAAQNFYRLLAEADLSKAGYVALSDQDDVWMDDKLARGIAAMTAAGAVAYSSNVWAWDGTEPKASLTLVDKAQPQTHWDYLFSSAGPGCTYIFDASALTRFCDWLRGHRADADAIEYHDWLLYAWFRGHGYSWVIDPEPRMYYRQHGGNQLGANRGYKAVRRRLGDIRNGWFEDQVLRIARAVGAEDAEPIVSLKSDTVAGRMALLRYGTQLRRSRGESLLVASLGMRLRSRG